MRKAFSFADIEKECVIAYGTHALCEKSAARRLGVRIDVPAALYGQWPYNSSAYAFLQQLRSTIFDYGIVEFPGLPLNKTNYTLAQRAPHEHAYSANPYLTAYCQDPHQDTPPYPTAFWLPEARRYSATWVMGEGLLQDYYAWRHAHPTMPIEQVQRLWVPQSLQERRALLLNCTPGLLLIDNSDHQRLYHARTMQFAACDASPHATFDTPMYAFNEVGLLQYIDTLDERRGGEARCRQDQAEVEAFLRVEGTPAMHDMA